MAKHNVRGGWPNGESDNAGGTRCASGQAGASGLMVQSEQSADTQRVAATAVD